MIVHLNPSTVLGLLRPLDAGRRHVNLKISAAAGQLTVSVLGYEATLPVRVERSGSFQIPHRVFEEVLRASARGEPTQTLKADPSWLTLGRESARVHEFRA